MSAVCLVENRPAPGGRAEAPGQREDRRPPFCDLAVCFVRQDAEIAVCPPSGSRRWLSNCTSGDVSLAFPDERSRRTADRPRKRSRRRDRLRDCVPMLPGVCLAKILSRPQRAHGGSRTSGRCAVSVVVIRVGSCRRPRRRPLPCRHARPPQRGKERTVEDIARISHEGDRVGLVFGSFQAIRSESSVWKSWIGVVRLIFHLHRAGRPRHVESAVRVTSPAGHHPGKDENL